MRIKSALAGILALFAVGSASAQQFPTVPDHTLIGRIGAVGAAGPSQAIPWATVLSKGILDQVGTAQGTIPCRGVSVWGPLVPGAAGTLLSSAGTAVCPTWISTVPVANGGTGSGTPAGARTGLNVESYTPHNDSNYAILATDRTVGTSAALTAPRTWTLPAANSVNPGQPITVADYFGGVTSVNTLTIARAGSDTINGATSVVINAGSGRYELRSDGVSKWSAMSSSSGGSTSSLQLKTPLDYGAACDGTTDDSIALQAWFDGIRSYAFLGWGLNGKTCIFGNNTNFAAPGLMALRSQTIIVGNYMTLKLKSSAVGGGNAGMTWFNGVGSPDQVTGSNFTDVSTLIIDGNRAGQTNTAGSGALFYVIGSTHVTMRDNQALNSRADGFYFGGNNSLAVNTTYVHAENLYANNNYRNGMSVVGVDTATFIGGNFTANKNTNNDGPQCGVDFESNAGVTTLNANIRIFGGNASSNGGTLSTTGGTGWCFFGPAPFNIEAYGIQGGSNQRYAIDNANTSAQVRIHGGGGAGNGTSTYSATTIDWFPSTVVKGAASGCGAGFACVGIPN